MKIKIKRDFLTPVLSRIQGITGRKTNMAITSCVLLQTGDSELIISATDMETGFEGRFPCEVIENGVVALNARTVYEIIKEFPSDDILIHEVEKRWIDISHQHVEYHLVGMDSEYFPSIPIFDDVDFIPISSLTFKKMIDTTVMISAESDEKREHIIGVHVETIQKEKNLFRMVSTDTKRLALVDCEINEQYSLKSFQNVLIPKKGLHEIKAFLPSNEKIHIGFKDNHFILKKDKESISIRLLEGLFPDYKNIFTRENFENIQLSRIEFLMMIKRMSILNKLSIQLNFGREKLIISTSNPDMGESIESMAIDFNGAPFEVAFNPRYFIEALNAIDSDTIEVMIQNNESPCIVKGVDDKSLINIIMPMRI